MLMSVTFDLFFRKLRIKIGKVQRQLVDRKCQRKWYKTEGGQWLLVGGQRSKVIRCSRNVRRQLFVSYDSAAAQRTGGCHRELPPVSKQPWVTKVKGQQHTGHIQGETHFSFSCESLQEILQFSLHVVVAWRKTNQTHIHVATHCSGHMVRTQTGDQSLMLMDVMPPCS